MNKALKIKAIPVEQPLGKFLMASMKPEDLVSISYADVRRLDERDIEKYLGIQRPLSKKRVAEIKDYISGKDATFPTSIILAIDEKCAEYDERTGVLTLKAWADLRPQGNLLPKSNSFRALMKYLKDDVYIRIVGNNIGKVPKVEEFLTELKKVKISDQDFTTRNFAPGSGGQSKFYRLLIGEITKEDLFG